MRWGKPFLFMAALSVTATVFAAQDETKKVSARALVRGPGGIEGIVTFEQPACPSCASPGSPNFKNFPQPTVKVVANISGPANVLIPGAHGMHIHENGVCDETVGFSTAGGHFDPGPLGHSTPVDHNHPFHLGDLPNLVVDEKGNGSLVHTTSRISLSAGPLSVFDLNGSAVIVHLNPDYGMNGVVGASGGPRIACGVLELLP